MQNKQHVGTIQKFGHKKDNYIFFLYEPLIAEYCLANCLFQGFVKDMLLKLTYINSTTTRPNYTIIFYKKYKKKSFGLLNNYQSVCSCVIVSQLIDFDTD
jgi:hypothetical protein